MFGAVEINTTFYRPHRRSTFLRWAALTPPAFAFSVKLPRAITHEARLVDGAEATARFLDELDPLRPKLGALLVQLPPSLEFDPAVADAFFDGLRRQDADLPVACEPRHASWLSSDAEALLARHRITRVAADPAPSPGAGEPGGWPGLRYYRLHGAPRMYYSPYGEAAVAALHRRLRTGAAPAWCIFDNTASGAAAADALALQALVARGV